MDEDKGHDKLLALSRSFIFQALDAETRRDLAAHAYVRRHKAGELIFGMGSPGQSMMAIAEGQVRISVVTPTARDVILAELDRGDVFGEIALLDGGERSADAYARTNIALVVLERAALLETMRQKPQLSLKLIELLCARLRRSDERMMEIAFLELPVRVAKVLLGATAQGADGSSPRARISFSQSEIADRIGGSRENVNRCLGKWQKQGLIEIRDGWLIVLDRSGLEAIADA
jgi:CRP/FNR family cyclic AMP-dependent transcriptional regulator